MEEPMNPKIADVQRAVAEHYGLAVANLVGPSRCRWHARPRHVAMHLAMELTGRSLADVSRNFHRHHSTVLEACRKVAAMAGSDRETAREVRECAAAARGEVELPGTFPWRLL